MKKNILAITMVSSVLQIFLLFIIIYTMSKSNFFFNGLQQFGIIGITIKYGLRIIPVISLIFSIIIFVRNENSISHFVLAIAYCFVLFLTFLYLSLS